MLKFSVINNAIILFYSLFENDVSRKMNQTKFLGSFLKVCIMNTYFIHYDKNLINCCFYRQAVGWLGKLMVDDMVALKWCMVLTSSLHVARPVFQRSDGC